MKAYRHEKVYALVFDGETPQQCAGELIAAASAFGGEVFVPRGVSFEITCLDAHNTSIEMGRPPRPYWFIRGPHFEDARVSDDDVVSVVEDLVPTFDVVAAIIDEALAQPAPGVLSLTDLSWEGLEPPCEIRLHGTNRFHSATLQVGMYPDTVPPELAAEFERGVMRVLARPGWYRD